MAKANKRKGTFTRNTYRMYGQDPQGNWFLQLIMGNDRKAYEYVSKNNKTLAKLPKNDAIKLIKSHIGSSWVKEDAKKVKNDNVRAKDLKWYLRNFND